MRYNSMKLTVIISCILLCSVLAATPKSIDKTKKYTFLVLSEECFDTFFSKGEFTNLECIKLTFSKALGTSIVVLSTILKLPQIIKILKGKSVEGLSFLSIILETTLYFFTVSYNLFKNNPFSLYGESVFIIIQNLIIITLFAKYGQNFNLLKLLLTFGFLASISTPLLLQLVPAKIYEFSLFINIVIGIVIDSYFQRFSQRGCSGNFFFTLTVLVFCSKMPQIFSNFKNKSTGQLAVITSILNTGGSVARTFTVLAEAPDALVLANSFQSVLLNSTILAQILIFWEKKQKKE